MLLKGKLTKRIFLIATLILAVATVASAFGGTISPMRFHSIPAIWALAFPYCVILLCIVGLIDIFVSPVSAWIVLMTLVICRNPLVANFPFHINLSEKSADIKLLTYNVANFRNFDKRGQENDPSETIRYILNSEADVVALQEFLPLKRNIRNPQPYDSLFIKYPYAVISSDRQAVFSKYPLTELSKPSSKDGSMIARAYNIRTGKGDITLLNLHLQSIGLTDKDREIYRELTSGRSQELSNIKHTLLSKLRNAFIGRMEQATSIRNYLNTVKGPVLICGDFNDVPLSYAQRTIMGDEFQDAYRQSAKVPSITFHVSRMYFRIDHILYNHCFTPIITYCDHIPSSDHYPVISKLIINQ